MSLLATLLLVGAIYSGCSSKDSSVHLTVSPRKALYDAPVTATLTGLSSGEKVELRSSSVDAHGVRWSSAANFVASTDGRVTTAQPPTSGSYRGSNAMGLFESQRPGPGATGQLFDPPSDWQITVSAIAEGKTVARQTVTRELALQGGVVETPETLAGSHLDGELFLPPHATKKRPAVVVFGGSEGGLSTALQAATLAAHGYPALALAYFDEPGLPKALSRIPLEYFERGVNLLRAQRGVDPDKVLVWGISRGSEAAQLLGADFPQLVHGVIATVPGAVAGPGVGGNYNQPAWTLHGRAVAPSDDLAGETTPSKPVRATIPVERIDGPILLVCGTADEIWPSCPSTTAIAARLSAHHKPAPTVVQAVGAGHLVGTLLPYLPDTADSVTVGSDTALAGGTPIANEAGRAEGWNALLALLNRDWR